MITIRKVLAPVDFGDLTELVTGFAVDLAEAFGAELQLVHVVVPAATLTPDPALEIVAPMVTPHEVIAAARTELARLTEQAAARVKTASPEILTGDPSTEIVAFAKDRAIDLIVIGTHGRRGLVHWILGSVAEDVVRKATCPVTTVRPTAQVAALHQAAVGGH